MLSPLQAQAVLQLRLREAARRDVLAYARAIEVPGKPETDDPDAEFFTPVESAMSVHHRLILSKMEEISRKPYGRVMFFMPPGSAKSTYASVVFPSRYLGAASGRKLILASYGDSLARKMGRRTRSIIRQPRYSKIFTGVDLTTESNSAAAFTMSNGSEYMACGILSGITGNRAHGLILDDPIKGRQQAESPTVRESTWSAYQDDLKTRLIPGGWIALIQTRWHEDDVAGRILPEGWNGESGLILCRDGFEWDVVCLQARCEVDNDPIGRARGEYLWPEWFDRNHWAQFESQPRTWAALFQQIPSPAEGLLFKPAMLSVVDAVPAGVEWVRAWDFAGTEGDGDWTAGAKLGKLPDGRYIIGDMIRVQAGPDERDALLKAVASADGRGVRIRIPQDPGQAGKTQVLYLTRQLEGYTVHSSPESGKKDVRAEPFAAQVGVGNVLMLRAQWNDALRAEMTTFPNGTHDDQVDALSRAFEGFVQPAVPGEGFLKFAAEQNAARRAEEERKRVAAAALGSQYGRG